VGLALLALGYTPGFPEPWLTAARWGGWGVCALVTTAAVALIMQAGWARRPRIIEDWYLRAAGNYTVRPGNLSDVATIIKLSDTFIDGGSSANFKARLSVRPDTATIIEDNTKRASIVGFYILLPLNSRLTTRIQTGVVATGAEIVHTDFTRTSNTARSIYLGGLLGIGAYARAYTILTLQNQLSTIFRENPRLVAVFARPATEHSLSLRHRYPMKPVLADRPDGIWQITREDAALTVGRAFSMLVPPRGSD